MSGFFNWLSNANNLVAFSTCVIAAFTVILAVVGYNQGRLMRREFLATHRPELVIREVRLERQSESSGKDLLFPLASPVLAYTLINRGQSWCQILESDARITLGKSEIPLTGGSNNVGRLEFTAGEFRSIRHTIPFDASLVGSVAGYLGTAKDHHLAIVIVYMDSLKIKRRLVFKRTLDGPSGTFCIKETESEYTD